MIYLDNAATTAPKPRSVSLAVDYAMNHLVANPGRSSNEISLRISELIFETRKKAATLFHFEYPEQVVFTLNCTHALNFVIKGCLEKGDHVVISNLEHNAVARPIYKLKQEGQITYDVATVAVGDEDATVSNFHSLIKPNTRMVLCTHASNVTGQVLPIRRLGELCRSKNIMFVVDSAQTAGLLDIDMKEDHIDFLCCAGHKGLYGPMGTGLLLAAKPLKKTLIEGGTGNFSSLLQQPEELPERMESGTVNVSGIVGLNAGLKFVQSKRIAHLYHNELSLIQKAYRKLSEIKGVTLYTPYPKIGEFVPVLSFNVGESSTLLGDYLNQKSIAVRSGLHCAPLAHNAIGTIDGGTVRISTSFFNTEQEINRFVSAVFDYTRRK